MAADLARLGKPHTDVELLELSIVLVANANNPTIMNPDFLQNNGIVSDLRPLQDLPPMSTPVLSQVAFEDTCCSITTRR